MIRNTRQRAAVRQAFLEAARPLNPAEVQQRAAATVGGIGLATVYRHLRSLAEEGWLVAVDMPGRPPVYELHGLRHHHHFHCRSCGKTFDVEGCHGKFEEAAPPGFTVEDHEVFLYGRCAACGGSNDR